MRACALLLGGSLSATCLLAGSAKAASVLTVSGYTHLTSPDNRYPDSGGSELTDGVTASLAWGGGVSISYSDVSVLTGWLNVNPTTVFTFDTPELVQSIVIHYADSNGAAGVGLPGQVKVTTPEGFEKLFDIIDPAGAGGTVPVTLSGFSTTSTTFTIESIRDYQWTMLSEVTFSADAVGATAVPTPAAAGMGLLGSLALVARRRRSR